MAEPGPTAARTSAERAALLQRHLPFLLYDALEVYVAASRPARRTSSPASTRSASRSSSTHRRASPRRRRSSWAHILVFEPPNLLRRMGSAAGHAVYRLRWWLSIDEGRHSDAPLA